ncbi:cytochrome oxidase c subunit VIb [Metarhizium robertsii]|uniref:Cytochrome c oxidase, subunit VIb n=2 Tax=Metarhizium robertsii TaxID=568076 RepID=E9EY19_METRA|nr:Cytochrome c oxidase, subunit VIb [Metarhizium robertsii ARSEF 23]EFY99989.1 Cytochrome c oxidase, subunit VIb [Metarhizium robertsii ARSEF 23]EXV06690.1 cytochrome oxidase c subunit VIb [Metarhizium robertsii]
MSWWPFSSSSRGDEIRSGTAIPTRQERAVCWAARDAYFACLDAHDILDANKDAAAARRACPRQSDDFERDCAAAWVKYFKQWRVADIQKKRRLEELRKQGAQEMEVSTTFAPDGGAGAKGTGKEDIQDMLERKKAR